MLNIFNRDYQSGYFIEPKVPGKNNKWSMTAVSTKDAAFFFNQPTTPKKIYLGEGFATMASVYEALDSTDESFEMPDYNQRLIEAEANLAEEQKDYDEALGRLSAMKERGRLDVDVEARNTVVVMRNISYLKILRQD